MNIEAYFNLPGGGKLHIKDTSSMAIMKQKKAIQLFTKDMGGPICINSNKAEGRYEARND